MNHTVLKTINIVVMQSEVICYIDRGLKLKPLAMQGMHLITFFSEEKSRHVSQGEKQFSIYLFAKRQIMR